MFAVGYGLWLLCGGADRRAAGRTLAIVAGAAVLVVAAWLVPEKIGSGELFRAASRALEPVAGTPARPTSRSWRRSRTPRRSSVAAVRGGIWYVLAAIVTCAPPQDRANGSRPRARGHRDRDDGPRRPHGQAGFTGNIRYLTVPIGLTGILGAAGLVRLGRLARARLGPRRGASRSWSARGRRSVCRHASCAPATRCAASSARRRLRRPTGAIARAGGRPRPALRIAHHARLDTQTVVRIWRTQVRAEFALVPGTIVAPHGSQLARDPMFPYPWRSRRAR